jgi:carbonic anhydrase/acetyltransferase-like protein (isoleucine patch superfamily)
MALVVPFGGILPRIGRDVFVASNATLVGDVALGDESSIWFSAVLRGDVGSIRVGARTNVQDLVCIHVTENLANTTIGEDVTVGHGCILHGCTIGDGCLIGLGSIVLDLATVGAGSVVAAGSLVPPRMVIPPRSLVRGSPAKVIREVTEAEGRMGIDGATSYLENARRFREALGDAVTWRSLEPT